MRPAPGGWLIFAPRWRGAGRSPSCTRRCSRVNGAGTSCTRPCAKAATRPGIFSRGAMRAACISAMTKHWANRKSARAFRRWAEALACAALLAALAPTRAADAPEPASCHTVRLADGGWTDVAATTALTSHLLRGLGYEAQNTLLSVPVTFAA